MFVDVQMICIQLKKSIKIKVFWLNFSRSSTVNFRRSGNSLFHWDRSRGSCRNRLCSRSHFRLQTSSSSLFHLPNYGLSYLYHWTFVVVHILLIGGLSCSRIIIRRAFIAWKDPRWREYGRHDLVRLGALSNICEWNCASASGPPRAA